MHTNINILFWYSFRLDKVIINDNHSPMLVLCYCLLGSETIPCHFNHTFVILQRKKVVLSKWIASRRMGRWQRHLAAGQRQKAW